MKEMHTELPWSVYEDVPKIAAPTWCFTDASGIRPYETASLTDHRGEFRNPADAAFIVRACNAHDELVSALRLALTEGEGGGEYEQSWLAPEVLAVIRKAIAKAKNIGK